MGTGDWLEWHSEYDQPGSSLARRLLCVRAYLRQTLAVVEHNRHDQLHILSICAGDGRDVLPVVAQLPAAQAISTTLIELDAVLADRARLAAGELRLRVEVVQADGGVPATYAELPRADILLACGVFGNISSADADTTIRFLPRLLRPGGVVIWTRGRPDHGDDPSQHIRSLFHSAGFDEVAFTAPGDARFRVGMSRLARDTELDPAMPARLFSFVA